MLIRLAGAMLHHAPLRSGLTSLSFNRVANDLFDDAGKAMTTMRDGTPIEVDCDDYHGRILYLFGTNDPKVSITVNALLQPGDVFLDIGANYSTIGILAASRVSSSGRIHLFEPQSRLANRVRRALVEGKHDNVDLHQVGLMDVDGTFTIRGPEHHSGMATFATHEDSGDFAALEVCEVRSIADYAGPLVEGRTFGAKIDIEGAEPLIMPWLVSQANLRFLVFEAAHHHRELYDAVVAERLALFGLNRHPLRMRLTRVDRFDEMTSFHDFVAVRGREARILPKFAHPRHVSRLVG